MRYRSFNLGNQGANTAACIAAIPADTTILDLGCCDFNQKNCLGAPPDLAKVFAAIPNNVKMLVLVHNFSVKGRYSSKNNSEERSFTEWLEALSVLPKTIKKIEFHIDDIRTWSKSQCREVGRALSFDMDFSVIDDFGQQVDDSSVDEIKRNIGAEYKKSQANKLFELMPLPTDVVMIIQDYVSAEEIQTVNNTGSLGFKLSIACGFIAPLITLIALTEQFLDDEFLKLSVKL